MVARVSFNGNYDLTLRNLQDVSSRYRQTLAVASSGKRVNGPEDDPGAYGRIQNGHTQQQQYSDYRKGLGTAAAEMYQADSVLNSVFSRITRARELAVMGANGSYNAQDRAAMAQEVSAIREDLLLMANTRVNDRYIFAGQLYDQPAYDTTGTYQGDAVQRSYVAGLNYTLPVSMTGDEVFGTAAGGVDLFTVLDTLAADLNADNVAGVQTSLDDLQSGLDQISRARSTYGTRVNQAEELNSFYASQSISVTERVSQDEDIESAQSYSDLARLSTAMQATLQVSASASKLSLLDYI